MQQFITKIFRFEAAHLLPNHDGKCRRLHGHSYKLEVTIAGGVIDDPESPKDGMIMDFADLSRCVHDLIVNQWDHRFLACGDEQGVFNTLLPASDISFVGVRTTAENLSKWIFELLASTGLPVIEVRLWETDTSCASTRISLND